MRNNLSNEGLEGQQTSLAGSIMKRGPVCPRPWRRIKTVICQGI